MMQRQSSIADEFAQRTARRFRHFDVAIYARSACCLIAVLSILDTVPAMARTLGMVVDNANQTANVFDADTLSLIGSVKLGLGGTVGDCTISGDQTVGFVTDFRKRVWVIDLTGTTPQLLGGTNPVPISNPGEDTSLTPNRAHVVVCDGALTAPVSVVAIADLAEVEVFDAGADCNSVDVCADGSVLITSKQLLQVRRLLIASDGTLVDTGEVLQTPDGAPPNNVTCGTDARSGVVLTQAGTVASFTVPGLQLVSSHVVFPSAFAVSGTITAGGDRLYVRLNTEGLDGAVVEYAYDPPTGAYDPTPVLEIPTTSAIQLYGVEQLGIDPNGERLFVPQPGALDVFDATSGELVDQIGDEILLEPSGVCFPTATCGNGVLEIGEECDDGNLSDADCCSANCRVFAASPACNDGNVCTQDVCSASGRCVNQAAPLNSCFAPGRAKLRIRTGSPKRGDRVEWKWAQGDDVSLSHVGDPTAATAYTLCLFDETDDGIVASDAIDIPSGANWTPPKFNRRAFIYNDRTESNDGVRRLNVRPGSGRQGRVLLKGSQANLPGLVASDSKPRMFSQRPKITAELRNSEGHCWSTQFFSSNVTLHDERNFLARMRARKDPRTVRFKPGS